MKHEICVFGGCSVDQYYYKDEIGNVTDTPTMVSLGGKGANQAVAASRAGVNVVMLSKIGNDSIGQEILNTLKDNNINTDYIEMVDELENDYAEIIIDNNTKDNEIIRHAGAIDSFTKDMIEKYKHVLLNSKFVVAQLKVPKEVSIELINFCYNNSLPLCITPCRPQKLVINDDLNTELLDKITYITANKKECETIFNTNNIEECVAKYPNKLIVTLGDEGVVYHNGDEIVQLNAIKVSNVEDTTGAGDTFTGNLIASLVQGYSLKEAIIRGQYASSMKLQKKGAQAGMPYKEELDKYLLN